MEENKSNSATGRKVAICALTLGRPEMTEKTWNHNLKNAGCDFDLYWFDNGSNEEDFNTIFHISKEYKIDYFNFSDTNIGIAKALNDMITMAFARGNDYVFTMANDILEPEDFLIKRIIAAEEVDNTGVVAIPLAGAHRYPKGIVNGHTIEQGQVIGNYLITRRAYDAIGLFCTDYDPYGPIDLDYCDRLSEAGIRRYYLSDEWSIHLGTNDANPKDYQGNKKEALARSWQKYTWNVEKYRRKEYLKQPNNVGTGGGDHL